MKTPATGFWVSLLGDCHGLDSQPGDIWVSTDFSELEKSWASNWRHREAILKHTLKQAAAALENARPTVKARAIASANEDQFDGLLGEIERVLFNIRELKLQ